MDLTMESTFVSAGSVVRIRVGQPDLWLEIDLTADGKWSARLYDSERPDVQGIPGREPPAFEDVLEWARAARPARSPWPDPITAQSNGGAYPPPPAHEVTYYTYHPELSPSHPAFGGLRPVLVGEDALSAAAELLAQPDVLEVHATRGDAEASAARWNREYDTALANQRQETLS